MPYGEDPYSEAARIEIKRLQDEIERLREALERIRDYQYCDAYNMVKKIAGAALGREE